MLIGITLIWTTLAYSQQMVLLVKKKASTVRSYWKGEEIAFQTSTGSWVKGDIIRIQNDSFYVRPTVVHYSWMGTDTVRFNIIGFRFTDIGALPKKGVLVDYKNGVPQIMMSAGHRHWYWIKNGWILRTAAAGYAGLHIANGVIKNEFSISQSSKPLILAGGVFLGGLLLKWSYKPVMRIGRKYHIETLELRRK